MKEQKGQSLELLASRSKERFLDSGVYANQAIESVIPDEIIPEDMSHEIMGHLMDQSEFNREEVRKICQEALNGCTNWVMFRRQFTRGLVEAEMCRDPEIGEEAVRRYGHDC